MSTIDYVRADRTIVTGELVPIDYAPNGNVVQRSRCDVGAQCDRPEVHKHLMHNVALQVGLPGYPVTSVAFQSCDACLAAAVPNKIRQLLAATGASIPPGLAPDGA